MIVLNKNLINPLFDIIKSFHITLLLKELNFKGKFTAIKRSKAMQIISDLLHLQFVLRVLSRRYVYF